MGNEISKLSKLYALLVINKKAVHGYELMKELGEKLGKKISPGEIYPFLSKLKKQGLVAQKKSGARGKKVYYYTPKGRRFCKNALLKFSGMIEFAVESKIKTCMHCGCEIYHGGHAENIAGKKTVFCCKHCAKAYKAQK